MARGKLPNHLPNSTAEGGFHGHAPEVSAVLPAPPATPDEIPMIPAEAEEVLPDLPDAAGTPFDIFAGL